MGRPLRIDPTSGWHHVMNRGVDRCAIFLDDHDRVAFGRALAVVCERYGIEVHAYCLMTTHFHLLVHCPEGRISEAMHDLTGSYARHFNARHGRVGHLFGDRFTSRLVTTERYIAAAVRYIHRNPLDIAGIGSCDEYRWSSHRTYLGHRRTPPWLRIERVLSWFGGTTGFATFVEDRDRPDSTTIHSAEELLSTVDLVIAERSDVAGRGVIRQRRALALTVAVAAADDVLLEDLGFGPGRPGANARWRARSSFRADPQNVRLVTAVSELLDRPSPTLDTAA